jgi:hypothetical protein
MFEVITEYDIYGVGYKSEFYNLYCYKKDLEYINKRYKNKYDYETILKLNKYKNRSSNYWLGKSDFSSGIPYGVVVFNLDYEEKSFRRNYEFMGGTETIKRYEISLNEWKGRKTLQLKINGGDNTDKCVKDVLRDCYDNMIIIDFGFDYVLVIEELPMYSYFSLIDENKYNNNFPIKYYYYDDKYVSKYICKRPNRESFDDLLEIIAVPDNNNKIKQKKDEESGVDMSKAPAYMRHLTNKKKQKLKNKLI